MYFLTHTSFIRDIWVVYLITDISRSGAPPRGQRRAMLRSGDEIARLQSTRSPSGAHERSGVGTARLTLAPQGSRRRAAKDGSTGSPSLGIRSAARSRETASSALCGPRCMSPHAGCQPPTRRPRKTQQRQQLDVLTRRAATGPPRTGGHAPLRCSSRDLPCNSCRSDRAG